MPTITQEAALALLLTLSNPAMQPAQRQYNNTMSVTVTDTNSNCFKVQENCYVHIPELRGHTYTLMGVVDQETGEHYRVQDARKERQQPYIILRDAQYARHGRAMDVTVTTHEKLTVRRHPTELPVQMAQKQ